MQNTVVVTILLGILVGLVSCAALEFVKKRHNKFMLPALLLAVGLGLGAPILFPILRGFYQAGWVWSMMLWVFIGGIVRAQRAK